MPPNQTPDGRLWFTPPNGLTWPPVKDWGHAEWSHWLKFHDWDQDRIDQYFYHDRYTYGLGFRRHDDEPYTWFYNPIPRAVEYHSCKTPNILYGGAVGGTKSTATRFDAYRHCWAIEEFTAIIMRRTHQELKRNHMKFVAREAYRINKFMGQEIMEWVPTEFELRFKHNGSVILFGHCQNAGDEEKYLSDEYDAFYPDEVATFLREQILGVASRLRSTKYFPDGTKVLARLGATSNPGGAYTLWLRDYFITKKLSDTDAEENPDYNPDEYHYIHAKLYDNPYLMDPDGTYRSYENRLLARGRSRALQLLAGDWNLVTGQFFEEWGSAHVGLYMVPPGCRIERWVDWGYSKPGVCHWVAILPSGRLHPFHEYKFQGTIASEVAKTIKRETDDILKKIPGGRVTKSIGDPAMFGIDGHTGESYAETFARHGVPLTEGDNQRVLGWGRMRHWLANAPDGQPWIVWAPGPNPYGSGCPYAVRTIPSLIKDKNDPEDVNTDGEDHAADLTRYGLMARPSPAPTTRAKMEPLPDSVRALMNQAAMADTPRSRPFGKVM